MENHKALPLYERGIMKKLLIIILSILSVSCFMMAGCMGGGSKTSLESDYFVTSENGTLSCTVSNTTEELYLGDKFTVDEDASYIVSYDEEGQNLVQDETLPLIAGDNVCFITVTNKGQSKTYSILIYRNKTFTVSFSVDGYSFPAQTIEEGKTAEEPTIDDWSKSITWEFDFDSKINSDVTISGTVNEIPTLNRNVPYYSIYTNLGGEAYPQSFIYENIASEPLKVAFEDTILSKEKYEYSNNSLTIDYSVFTSLGPDKTIKVMTRDAYYEINLLVATFAIESTDDLNMDDPYKLSVMQQAGGATAPPEGTSPKGNSPASKEFNHWDGYFILTRDIDFRGVNPLFSTYAFNTYGGTATYGFAGTLDGRGYALKNVCLDNSKKQQQAGGNGWFTFLGNLESSAVIKNIRFVNFSAVGNYFEGFFSKGVLGSLENVYIESTQNYSSNVGVLGIEALNGFSMKDCTFVIKDGSASTENYALFKEIKGSVSISGTNVITDYALPINYNANLFNHYSYNDSIISASLEYGASYTLNVDKTPLKVLKDGEDITSKLTVTSSSITFPGRVWSEASTFVVIWEDDAKIIEFTEI